MRVALAPAWLTVLYDEDCALCWRCRVWIEGQEQLVPVRFVSSQMPGIQEWANGLLPVGDELVVVDNQGQVWVGPDAFITCLWALRRYRSMANHLQRPGMSGVAKATFHHLSGARGAISRVLGDNEAGKEICDDGSCGTGAGTPHS